MKAIVRLLIAFVLLFIAAPAKTAQTPNFNKTFNDATALLYAQDDEGGLAYMCTTTAFAKTDVGYLLVTAKHCVNSIADAKGYFVVWSENVGSPYVRADVLFEAPNTDAAVLGVITDLQIPVVPLGDEHLETVGNSIVNVASPMGLGKLFFRGSIVSMCLEQRVQNAIVPNALAVQLPTTFGSSGSAVVSETQHAIIGIVSMIMIPKNGGVIITLVVPISSLRIALAEFAKDNTPKK